MHTSITARASRTLAPSANAIVGETYFKINPGHNRKVSVLLNKKGRRLLNKRGSLNVQVMIHMNASSGLPAVTKAGVVTITKFRR